MVNLGIFWVNKKVSVFCPIIPVIFVIYRKFKQKIAQLDCGLNSQTSNEIIDDNPTHFVHLVYTKSLYKIKVIHNIKYHKNSSCSSYIILWLSSLPNKVLWAITSGDRTLLPVQKIKTIWTRFIHVPDDRQVFLTSIADKACLFSFFRPPTWN